MVMSSSAPCVCENAAEVAQRFFECPLVQPFQQFAEAVFENCPEDIPFDEIVAVLRDVSGGEIHILHTALGVAIQNLRRSLKLTQGIIVVLDGVVKKVTVTEEIRVERDVEYSNFNAWAHKIAEENQLDGAKIEAAFHTYSVELRLSNITDLIERLEAEAAAWPRRRIKKHVSPERHPFLNCVRAAAPDGESVQRVASTSMGRRAERGSACSARSSISCSCAASAPER